MKKIKIFAVALLAVLVAGLTACNPNKNEEYNYTAYQKAVNETVKTNKKNSKVILLVAFGSTWQQAFDAFDTTVDAYKKAFPQYDVFLSFSSAICINRAAAGENAADGAQIRNYYAPPFWLTAFAQKGVMYNEIVVQSLQVIPGEEYTRVINYIKDFANNANGDIDDDYLSRVILKLGVPLLQDENKDVTAVAKALDNLYKTQAANDIVAFMGHGNPDSYDTYKANIRYTQLEEALQAINPHYFVGTVDMMENFKPHVYERMAEAGLNKSNKKVYLHPLMSIDGDHGHNDMAGDDLPEEFQGKSYTFADLMATANEEGEVEDCSWKMFFGANGSGFTCDNSTMIEKGLLELPSIRQVWMNHTQNAINGEPLDYYHSKNPE
ncbi:MAG: sirohydrochlorin cobaltochelatase [Bacteroidales bacterium]|nr:sirohydrochlorin cobaltochelatase [Bacteroidales bacterium]